MTSKKDEKRSSQSSEPDWEKLGNAFGAIEGVQKDLASLDVPLVQYLLEMAKLEVARYGTGLSFERSQDEPTDASVAEWVRGLRDGEDEPPPARPEGS